MRSTRYLSITVAVVTVLLVAVGVASAGWLGQHQSPHASSPHPTTSAHPSTSSAHPSTTTQAPATSAGAPPPSPGRAAHDPRPAKVATAFAKAFAHDGKPRMEWVRQVKPHLMPESRGLLSTIDPKSVDVHRVTGPPQVQQAGDAVARVTVPMDTHPLPVLVVHISGQWKVRSWGGD